MTVGVVVAVASGGRDPIGAAPSSVMFLGGLRTWIAGRGGV